VIGPATQAAFGGKGAAIAAAVSMLTPGAGPAAPPGADPAESGVMPVVAHLLRPGVPPSAAVVQPHSTVTVADQRPQTITVKSGNTLRHLADKFYGSEYTSRWWQIYEANRDVIGGDPNLIITGEHLLIPAEPSAVSAPHTAPAQTVSTQLPTPATDDVFGGGGTWSIFQQPNGHMQAVIFAESLLNALDAPITPGNVKFVYDWQVSEGGGGQNNPLNGGDFDGMATSGEQYGGGANDYPDLQTNVRAMAGILENDTVSALQDDDPTAAMAALFNSEWAGGHYGWGEAFSDAPVPG
jgi:hypothetical protein